MELMLVFAVGSVVLLSGAAALFAHAKGYSSLAAFVASLALGMATSNMLIGPVVVLVLLWLMPARDRLGVSLERPSLEDRGVEAIARAYGGAGSGRAGS